MGLVMLFITAIMWSFVGILVKTASTMVDSSVISLSRFFFGVVFLAALLLIRDKKLTFNFNHKWIWFGALGKSLNYILENIGISMGFAYGNVLVMPLQTVFTVIISVFIFKEKLDTKGWISVLLCMAGAFLISWNGLPLSVFMDTNFITTLLFFFSAVGVVFHFLSQKMLARSMESAQMNLSVFLVASVMTSIPIPFSLDFTPPLSLWPSLSLVALGFITGISFYLYSNALKTVNFLVTVIIGNSSILFTLLWSGLFFNEPITMYLLIGSICFIIGIILLNLPRALIDRMILRFKAGWNNTTGLR